MKMHIRNHVRRVLALGLALAAGCAGLPRRDTQALLRYPARQASNGAPAAPALPSVYQDHADQALAAPLPVHYVQLLETGTDALRARLHLIRAARATIDIQTFIWKQDAVTRVLFAELQAAADRGVRVRLLIDALHPPGTPAQTAAMAAAHERIELCLHNPVSAVAQPNRLGWLQAALLRFRGLNRRMHSKTFTVDGRIAIIGGRNYEGKYYDLDPEYIFKDREVVVMGPAVADVRASFETFWTHRRSVHAFQFRDVQAEYAREVNRPRAGAMAADYALLGALPTEAEAYDPGQAQPGLAIAAVAQAVFVADLPSRSQRYFKRLMTEPYRELVRSAADRLVFQTPYLIYDPRQRRDLRHARRNQPELRVVVSSNSLAAADHLHVYAISYKHRRPLLRKMGLEIYEFRPVPGDAEIFVPGFGRSPPLTATILSEEDAAAAEQDQMPAPLSAPGARIGIHAKTLVVDGRVALIGSHNFDPRSANLNAECGLLIADPAFALRVEEKILRDCAPRNSWVVARQPVRRRSGGGLGRELAALSARLPFFDVWPRRYTSLYEPHPGEAPRRPSDPEFFDRYRDVGPFPEVNEPATIRRLKHFKRWAGWARPLL